jgi:hypothetical protein
VADNLPPKDQPNILPALYALIACSSPTIQHVRSVPVSRSMAHPSVIVTAGYGLTQLWGGPVEQIRSEDVILFAPGEKHWHGATATTRQQDRRLDGKGHR